MNKKKSPKNKIDFNGECPICYDEYNYDKNTNEIKFKVELKCSHFLCLDCLNGLQIKKCPLCRAELELRRYKKKKINTTDFYKYLNENNDILNRAEGLRIFSQRRGLVNSSISINNLDTINSDLKNFMKHDNYNDIKYVLTDIFVNEILYTVDTLIYEKNSERKRPDFYKYVTKLLDIFKEIIKFEEYYIDKNIYNILIDTAKIMVIYDNGNPANYIY